MSSPVQVSVSERGQSGRLPRRFPVGTKYVVEGRGGENGHLRVVSRYVVLPGGRRINVTPSLTRSVPLKIIQCRGGTTRPRRR